MARNIPPLNALRAFEATARYSSFSRAADELNVVHTSIARHVRNLEEWLGVSLVAKSGRKIFLTEDGRRLFSDIENVFDQIEKATATISTRPDKLIRLSIEPVFMHQWFAKRFYSPEWAKKFDGFDIEIQSSAKVSDLDKGEADIALRHTLHSAEDLGGDLIAEEVVYPFLAPAALEGGKPRTNIEKLLEQPLIYAHRPGRWESWFQAAGYSPVPPLKLTKQEDFRVAMLATFSGQAGMLMCKELMQDDVDEGRLVQVSDIGLPYGRTVLLTAKLSEARPEVRKARAILKELLSTFGQTT